MLKYGGNREGVIVEQCRMLAEPNETSEGVAEKSLLQRAPDTEIRRS